MNLKRGEGGALVIGHRGAAAVEPENTLAALQAGVAAGADLVEFDVGPDLRLAHSECEVPADPITLDAALEFVRGSGVGAHVDVKLPGYESDVVAAIRRHELAERVVISSAWPVTIRRLADLAPELPRAIGYPRDRFGAARVAWPAGVVLVGRVTLRSLMARRVPLMLRGSRANALSLHHMLCSRAAVEAAHRHGAPVLAWTANDPRDVRRLDALGVDAIVSDDPALARRVLEGARVH